jgi:hypothetical protein
MARRGENAARQTMAAGGAIFALSALALVLAPDRFAEILGLTNTDSVSWSLRMLGFCLVPLVYVLFVVRGSMADHVVRAFAFLMGFISLALGVVTLTAPGPATAGRWAFALVGFGFAGAYLFVVFKGKFRKTSRKPGSVKGSPRSRGPA